MAAQDTACLHDLPDEMIVEIFTHLNCIRSFETQSKAFKNKDRERARQHENNLRTRSLYSLCLTSHRLRALATSILYANYCGASSLPGAARLRCFQRTIASPTNAVGLNLRLSQCVRYIENRSADISGDILSNSIRNDDLRHKMARYHALLANVVRLSPNLRHLSVVTLEIDGISFWDHIVLADIASPTLAASSGVAGHGFLSLQSLCVQVHTVSHTGRPSALDRLWQGVGSIPQLTDLRVSSVVSGFPSIPPPGTFRVLQRLEIIECGLDFEELNVILSACRSLKHIGCQWAFRNEEDKGPSDLHASLMRHSSTLETFHLDIRNIRYDEIASQRSDRLGTLRAFTCLRAITICESSLVDINSHRLQSPLNDRSFRIADQLPTNVEDVTLLMSMTERSIMQRETDEAVLLWQLVDDCRLTLHELTRVCISSNFTISVPKLERAFSDIGVHLDCTKKPRGN